MHFEEMKEEVNWNEDSARPILWWITETKEEIEEEYDAMAWGKEVQNIGARKIILTTEHYG